MAPLNAAQDGDKPVKTQSQGVKSKNHRRSEMKKAFAIMLVIAMVFAVTAQPVSAAKKHHKHKAKVVMGIEYRCPFCLDGKHHDCPYWYINGDTGEEAHMTLQEIKEFEEMEMR